MPKKSTDTILQILRDHGPLNAKQIQSFLSRDISDIHSALYGPLHEFVIRDKNEEGHPVWRIKAKSFEAARGLEVMFQSQLIHRGIITPENSILDYQVTRGKKIFHLDLAIFQNNQKYDIEIDGLEHLRADAMLSIQNQMGDRGDTDEIEIDWMDHEKSFVDFGRIDTRAVHRWCLTRRDWCIRYHEELLKTHDTRRSDYLIESGWRLLRFWNFQLRDDLEKCLQITTHWLTT